MEKAKLCVSIRPENESDLFLQIQEVHPRADIIEIRLDGFSSIPYKSLSTAISHDVPVLLSLGRAFCQDKMHRDDEIQLYMNLANLSPEWLDVPATMPVEVFQKIAREYPHVKVIASYHNFENTPDDLDSFFHEMIRIPCACVKIVTFANTSVDGLKFLNFLKKASLAFPITGMCMGDKGSFTRILAPIYGSSIVYTCIKDRPVASGQIFQDDLISIYDFVRLSSRTKPYALIGNPVSQSLSHITHNAVFKQLGIDAVYVKIALEKEEFSEAIQLFLILGFKGLSVTMPLKELFKEDSVKNYFDNTVYDPEFPYNTVSFTMEGMSLYNTDGLGMLNAIEQKCTIKGKMCVIIGAGGTAAAIAKEAIKRGAYVVICNRTSERAIFVASRVGCSWEPYDALANLLEECDILINATPIGMPHIEDSLPISMDMLSADLVVADVVSTPGTELVQMAESRGCSVISGRMMWYLQAVEQFSFWLEHKANQDIVYQTLVDKICECTQVNV